MEARYSCLMCERSMSTATTLALRQLPSSAVRFRHNAIGTPQFSSFNSHFARRYYSSSKLRFQRLVIRNVTDNPTKRTSRSSISSGRKSNPIEPASGKTVRSLNENGDPLGRRDLGKSVVRWIRQGMKAMATDFALTEMQGEFSELRQRMGPGLTFVIEAQPYLTAIPMPLGLEALCLKACTHYPTLFDHFQRELRDVLQDLQNKSLVHSWCETESWKLLKELANSVQHRAVARKVVQPKKNLKGVLGIELEKVKAIQSRIDEFTKRMSELLCIERDAELEFTQEELDAVPTPDENSDASKPIEFLVSHGQAQQELCDTICNLNAVSTSTGLL